MATNNCVNNKLGSSLIISSDGAMTLPNQPSFLTYLSSNVNNVTGNGAVYTVAFNAELFDKSSSVATGTFTAPITGIYLLSASIALQAATVGAATSFFTSIVTTQNTFRSSIIKPSATVSSTTGTAFSMTVMASMTAGDTASISVTGAGLQGNTIGLQGSSSPIVSYFSGALLN